jgi:hypothetical protein
VKAQPFDPRAELAQVARRTRSAVRALNLAHPLAAEPFDQEFRFTRDGHRVTWRTNGRLFMIDVAVASRIVFAAGRPDPILGASRPCGVAAGITIFEHQRFSPTAWLSEPGHSGLVAAVGLNANEQLLVVRNETTLIFEPRGLDVDWERLGDLLRLVNALPPDDPPSGTGELIDGLRFDAATVTAEHQQLLPMLRRWATGDDTTRSDQIAAASDDDLRELVAVVAPERSGIDALIDYHDEPVPDEAILLGRLAEASSEAEHELARRRKE